ncbi:AraC family transcriptional regulator [Myxococcus llanfairpwllgwyngyllgogerychwyrndrobwllllantysiliogogogochensis]|nr:helix-turn-helix domain-containing protein [Myxococcus llanfairpwllgwyngyllgogerychwyrndrobwllllantysiliogogogochensis]
MPREKRWLGHAMVGPRWLAYWGTIGPTQEHAHHAFQLIRATEEPLPLVDAQGCRTEGQVAVIPPDTPHRIERGTARALLVFVDPDDRRGRGLRRLEVGESSAAWIQMGTPLLRVPLPTESVRAEDWTRLVEALLAQLMGEETSPGPVHPAIKRLIELLPSRIEAGDVSQSALAREVGLSASRLGHLFSTSVGIPLRPYILWLRLRRATEAFQGGATLTQAAHVAGFTDSSHLSNTFHRMFGLAPSEIARGIGWVSEPLAPSK